MSKLLVIPKIKIQNANAISSPYTIGFPAMTAWLGAVHALQRKMNQDGYKEIMFTRFGVVSHEFDLQVSDLEYDRKIKLTRRAPTNTDEVAKFIKGSPPPLIPEGRCHLTVSLVIEYNKNPKDEKAFIKAITDQLHSGLKMTSGDIIKFASPKLLTVLDMDEKGMSELTQMLMPGYALTERRDLMEDAMEQGQDAIDALLDQIMIHHQCEKDAETEEVTWESRRSSSGWIVPIATGFHGLTKLKQSKGQRDKNAPHRFAESIVTLGEFIMPYRLDDIDELLWKYTTDEENNLYLCTQNT